MKSVFFILVFFTLASSANATLRVPASTAYIDPDPNGAKVSKEHGVTNWTAKGKTVLWFGEFKNAGKVQASIVCKLASGKSLDLELVLEGAKHKAVAHGNGEQTVSLGAFDVAKPGIVKFELHLPDAAKSGGAEIVALELDGDATQDAHFNLDPRRNAASVHLNYAIEKDTPIAGFYNEVTAVEDPLHTYYMACGFARGYFGMQVNSPTERRIIFSVWDSGSGQSAKTRTTVSKENQVQLLAKGPGVVAGEFGNEGTGGHSHFVYPWKTGSTQKFYVTAQAEGDHTDYAGWWFHPEEKKWKLIAKFRAPNDGKWLRGLYSFNEDFAGENGHLQRKALFGPQWIRLSDGKWQELTTATFSHDGTGKANRIDRFMGVEGGRFFLSNGGFVPGFTKGGDKFDRPASGKPPVIELPEK